MKLVFQYISDNPLSLYSLSDFYETGKRVSEKQLGITTVEKLTEIRIPYLGTKRTGLHFFVELSNTHQTLLQQLKSIWENIGESYGWKLIGILKKDANIPTPIDASLLSVDWLEEYN